MSNEQEVVPVQAPEVPVKPKQYLLMLDEISVAILSRLCPAIQYVQVEGINMQGNDSHLALVTPIIKPVDQPVDAQPVEAPKVD